MKRLVWEWDSEGTVGYNIIARFEITLMNMGIAFKIADIDATEAFDKKFSLETIDERLNTNDGVGTV